MKDSLRSILFAAVIGVAAAGLLTAANRLLADRQQANKAAEELRNIFAVLDVPFDATAGAKELLKLRADKLRERTAGEVKYYEYDHPTAGLLRAIEFGGPGLWGPVKGLICLKGDLRTIFRISFYEHEETPGLGGEIGTDEFQGRFPGKRIAAGDEGGVRIVRAGAATGDNDVDAISGATMTCDKVQAMLDGVGRRIAKHRDEILRESGHGE